MKAFTEPLTEYDRFVAAADAVKSGRFPVRITGCTDSSKANIISALSKGQRARLVLTKDDNSARRIEGDLSLYDSNVLLYPAKDMIFYSSDIRGNALMRDRLKCIEKITSGAPVTIVMCITACMDKLLPLKAVKARTIHIDMNSRVDVNKLSAELVEMGYEKEAECSEPGSFAVRGGIVDIYPLACEAPYRIELFDDEIDSIRIYDAASQRSVENINGFDIFPACEYVLSEERIARACKKIRDEEKKRTDALKKAFKTQEAARLSASVAEFIEDISYIRAKVAIDGYVNYFFDDCVSVLDYFMGKSDVVYIDEPIRCVEMLKDSYKEFEMSMKNRYENGYILPGQRDTVFDSKKVIDMLSEMRVVQLSALDNKCKEMPDVFRTDIAGRSVNSYNGDFEMLVKDLTSRKKDGFRVLLLSSSGSRAERLAGELRNRGLTAFCTKDPDRTINPGEIMVASGRASSGFEYPLAGFAVITQTDIFGHVRQKKAHKNYSGAKIPDLSRLSGGDYVVHESYGVGIYRGIEKIEVDHVEKDYIKIEYAGGGTLYVLASSMDSVQKYSGPEGHTPKLNKLDSSEWKNTRSRVRTAVQEIAQDLIKLYAERTAKKGFEFSKDTVWQKEFEEQFPYEETHDQLRAIEDTKRDMESRHVMDRLICGDVGFGKTEIAIRAAFKAVQDGKQVAVLVPTTILAQQHYNTFSERMAESGVTIEMLSRFRTAQQQKKIISKLAAGQIDIIIGTHRLLSKDVVYKDLGLLVVDEEQRFGVTHKEKIKQLRSDVDVLTLTATPIPRTLHMSLVGIRDMSILEEAPVDRLPIQTFVLEHNDEVIREAIRRELSRGGQVYYVFNRVRGIDDVTKNIQRLVPEAVVVSAHGQMGERELERIMFSFVNGEIDVLVSTTIIETGLDISNVNTMIIDDADRLGLSQLYQLRGRVGRSARTAYAFIMYKLNKELSEVSEKRLAAIREFTDLGSGFRIAMKDLEIRGAGNLLGAEQSGHMESVGYDLYCKLLSEAVKSLQSGEESETDIFDTSVDIEIDAFIPSSYIKNEIQKLEAYKKIASVLTEGDRSDMEDELTDRYGDLPAPVHNLLNIALIKSMAHELYITSVSQKKGVVRIDFYPKAKLKAECFPQLIEKFRNKLVLKMGKVPYLEFNPAGGSKTVSGAGGVRRTGAKAVTAGKVMNARPAATTQKRVKGIAGELLEFLPVMKEIMLDTEKTKTDKDELKKKTDGGEEE
ncbi:MAG: transcription-repair coupling factor [Lachnospiraceae bacterium]|nr:transcription-repair coupling factor [Lachnospiraceae bacterium]